MATKLYFVWLLLLAIPSLADSGDTLRPIPIRQVRSADSVTIARYDLAKLELARQTLLSINLDDIDELIDVLGQQAQLSEHGRQQLADLTTRYLQQQQDSLRRQGKELKAAQQVIRKAANHANGVQGLLSNLTDDLKVIRRRAWWERAKGGLVGAALAIALKSFVK
ncbi:hypothetical protein ACAW74_18075 [Fibrella sp. WM1]|uniref:hypothetical protein n=1 Tax=Fibrella musci TaxID=3242485 RepID=UPI00351FEBCC